MKLDIKDLRPKTVLKGIEWKAGDVFKVREKDGTLEGIAVVDCNGDYVIVFIGRGLDTMLIDNLEYDYVILENITDKTNILITIG